MTPTDLAYIAGFFDGEGCIGIYSRRRQSAFHLRIQLCQNSHKTSDRLFSELVEMFGGNLSTGKTSSGKLKYNWQLNSIKAVAFLEAILPYLRLKKAQAEVAIAWQKGRAPITRGYHGRIQAMSAQELEYSRFISDLLKSLKDGEYEPELSA